MKKIHFFLFLYFSIFSIQAQTTLTHNPCDDIIKTMNHSCSSSYIFYGRDFYLDEYGISSGEEYTITSGQVGISYAEWSASIQFNIYKIDDNFPDSFSENDLIGQSQEFNLPYIPHSYANTYNQIITIEFNTPVFVPSDVNRILVEVKKGLIGSASGIAHIAGTVSDDGNSSWYRGCVAGEDYINTDDFDYSSLWPGEDYNFYINVTGDVNNVIIPFSMRVTNNCSDFFKGFSLTNSVEIASVDWDFGDFATGLNNQSTELSPTHDFSENGIYTITANVISTSGISYTIQETIAVIEPPEAYSLDNLFACEDSFDLGTSSNFDTAGIHTQILGGRDDVIISYYDGGGVELPSPLPNPLNNTIFGRETISVRVSYENQPCCYSETTFDLIVNPLPDLSSVTNQLECDDDTDGFTYFDLEQVKSDIVGSLTNLEVNFHHQNGALILSPLSSVLNSEQYQETVTANILNTDTNCFSEITFDLVVNPLPIVNALNELVGCDDNNDGVSEYFDTSNVEDEVLGGQTGMEVSYFDNLGNLVDLLNPYTNSIPFEELITVRVTNTETQCYKEAILTLRTSLQPNIIQPNIIYACDEGGGFSHFDTSLVEAQLIGLQSGLIIIYTDSDGIILPSPLPLSFQNTESWFQTINVKVENELNPLCYSETSFDLIINQSPIINLEAEYRLCNLEPSLYLSSDTSFYSWQWSYEDGTILSNTFGVNISESGSYNLTVEKLENGIICSSSHSLDLIRSVLPQIENVEYSELSNNNYIEIIATGDGDFEYSIDGVNYQDSNVFENLQGGIYMTYVQDKNGCGEDTSEVIIIDYPKFFTPNNDDENDTWQIQGVLGFPNTKIYIYDRFGKIIKIQSANDVGWDGYYNGESLPASDYWFRAILGNGKEFSGHFSLVRR